MSTFYVAGDDWMIRNRLKMEERHGEVVKIQLTTMASIRGEAGWQPLPQHELFPCEPRVGDVFMCPGYWEHPETEDTIDKGNYWWRVVARELMLSGPGASELGGILALLVEKTDGRWREYIDASE